MGQKKLTDYFKCYKVWDHTLQPDTVLELISIVFTMKGDDRLYFKLKEPLKDDYEIGMDCFQFAFDTDNGIWLYDGDMRFNDFMGDRITDSGLDVVGFIKQYLIERNLNHLVL